MAPVHYHFDQFPPNNLEWGHLIPLIGPANAAIARYDGLLSAIPNSRVLLSPLTTQEAVLSSRIEGTVATIGEVLEVEAGGDTPGISPAKREDAFEILNYRKAMRFCENALQERALSPHLLRQAHQLLMAGVRGRDKNPGSFREQQNWIGNPGCSIDNASFVPIPQAHLTEGIGRWEQYVAGGAPDPLVQLAIIHAEFEALHPFMDGNGRLGRMIIPLFLHSRGILSGPHFYISAYLDANRDEYLDRLRAVSATGDWTQWVMFFLQGLQIQAKDNEAKARRILELYAEIKERAVEITHSQWAIRAVDFLFQTPFFYGTHFVDQVNIPKASANRMLALLREHGIVHTIRQGVGRRPSLYSFPQLVDVVEGRA